MTELLAPAGSIEALKAAISNGCDAIYLGMLKFGARAYSSNFDFDSLKEAIDYAHLRDVKIFVTMNTIIFEDELQEMRNQMDRLNAIGVDGIIVQDLAAFDYLVKNFLDLEVHCSTQMGIDDLEGTLLFKELGAKRVVLSRECSIDTVKRIKRLAKIPLEIFVHGALCISYSGNCLMSGLIGFRSGNRGRCVGSCRKTFELIDKTTNEIIDKNYILSAKDLNTIDHIEDLRGIDSLKIEGRMKEPAYVANVVSKYRKALDHGVTEEDKRGLFKTFNRTFTKGYLFEENKKDLTNISRPNNFGFEIGHVGKKVKDKYQLVLKETLHQNDIIRISHGQEDINLTAVKLYDSAGNLVNKAQDTCYIKIKERVSKGDRVYISKDMNYYKTLQASMEEEFKRFDIDMRVYAYPGAKLVIDAEGLDSNYLYESQEPLEVALKNPTSKDQVQKQLSKLGDTIFQIKAMDFDEAGAFIPVKLLNEARREIVQGLYDLKLGRQKKRRKTLKDHEPIVFDARPPYLTASVSNQDQYEACIQAGIEEVYFQNIIRRNQTTYKDRQGQVLIGGYGGLYHYRESNSFVTDYSLNVVNSVACYNLYKLGAKRVTLSYEINKTQLSDLLDAYEKTNGGSPSLEMIVYGKAPLLFTKYCPLEKMGQCGKCRNHQYEIKDDHGSFPILSHEDCTTTILNGKNLNLLDEVGQIKGVEAFRLNFTLETADQVKEIIRKAQGKLEGSMTDQVFNQATDTRGHYNKEIM